VAALATLSRTAAARALHPAVRGGTLVLAAAVPLLLLHADHQPHLELSGVDVKLSDLMLLAIAVAGALAVARDRPAARPWLPVAVPLLALMAWVFAGVAVGTASDRPYDAGDGLVSALGFAEYAVLALAVPALVRTARELQLVLWTLAAWLAVLCLVGLVQFLGADWLTTSPAGQRQPSLIGFHDLAAAGAVGLAIGLAALVLGWELGRLRVALLATGGVALVLSGSLGGGLGLVGATALVVVAALAAGTLTRRRLLTTAAVVAACLLGLVALRGGDIEQFGRFLGVLPEERTTQEDVQTYSHRTLLAYFGVRVFADHPVAGAGWQSTNDFGTLEPYLADAHRRFPDVAAQAFPSPAVPYGVQNGYVQALSDLGIVGLLLFLGALIAPVLVALRSNLVFQKHRVAGAAAVVACAGVWTAQGLVAGLPLDALAWMAVGLAAVTLPREPA
jgi:O-antigen ligase